MGDTNQNESPSENVLKKSIQQNSSHWKIKANRFKSEVDNRVLQIRIEIHIISCHACFEYLPDNMSIKLFSFLSPSPAMLRRAYFASLVLAFETDICLKASVDCITKMVASTATTMQEFTLKAARRVIFNISAEQELAAESKMDSVRREDVSNSWQAVLQHRKN
jgi:hypothetical protein